MRLLPCSMAVCALLLAGCASNRDAIDKELMELRAEVGRIRATQATLGERVDTLEINRGADPTKKPTDPQRLGGGDRPELDVVRLSPSEGDGDADPDGGRPVVRAVGNEGAILSKKGEKTIVLRGGFFKKSGAPAQPKKAEANSDPHAAVNP